jgi:hypothetical protein
MMVAPLVDENPPERPRTEPEIIPPDRDPHRPIWRGAEFADTRGTRRVYVTRLGPLGGAVLILAIIAVLLVILLVLLGALLIWIPVVGLLVLVAALSGLFGLRRR